jgi:CO/xanthine dehydrogenase Mo-binding subunit
MAGIRFARLLYGKILCSPHARTRIVSIATNKTETLSGMHAVMTAAGFPVTEQQPHDGRGRTGSRQGVVQGLGRCRRGRHRSILRRTDRAPIDVEYEVPSTAPNGYDAIRHDAPLLHENPTSHDEVRGFERGKDTGARGATR